MRQHDRTQLMVNDNSSFFFFFFNYGLKKKQTQKHLMLKIQGKFLIDLAQMGAQDKMYVAVFHSFSSFPSKILFL